MVANDHTRAIPVWIKVVCGCLIAGLVAFLLVLGVLWYFIKPDSRVEAVVVSPDKQAQVVVISSISFLDVTSTVYVEPLNPGGRGTLVADVMDASVTPHWRDARTLVLVIEHDYAESAALTRSAVNLRGKTIAVSLKREHPNPSDAAGNDNQLQPAVHD